MKLSKIVLAASLLGGCFGDVSEVGRTATSESSLGVHGAIFTTLVDGSRVNKNIYAAKEDVYLDGGPGDQAPASAAGLPEGDYYFMVTDPSGKTLLSSDAVECRRIHINDEGLIDIVRTSACSHDSGVDQDHGALTVQLMPYENTPNPGGEYKAWVTGVDDYSAGDGVHGFLHHKSKTDNFKVRLTAEPPPPPPEPFCGDGVLDAGEQCDDGNNVNGDGCDANCSIEQPPPPPPPPCCGDGHVDAGEECDDGNHDDGDGCSSTCEIEVPPPPPPPTSCCGDGHLDSGEACDDGNTTSGDGCSSICTTELTSEPHPTFPGCDGQCSALYYDTVRIY